MSESLEARWRRLDSIVEAALDHPIEARAGYLDVVCGDDVELRREVEQLLDCDRDDEFLATPAAPDLAEVLARREANDLVGRTIGRFRVVGRLGAGGMGEVYLAEDPGLERRVALKFAVAAKDDPTARERLRREARAAAALDHPNLCRVFELGEVDGRQFIVMEHLEGETLAERLAHGPVPCSQALAWGTAIAAALEQAHVRGLVHRDLKPGNIMVLAAGQIKVMDFGLVRPLPDPGPTSPIAAASTEATLGGPLLGTPGYLAPEQLTGAAADARCDVWAFGCVLFQMLTGARAFAGDSVEEILRATRDREPTWSRVPPETPVAILALMRRCLAKDPSRRPRHAGEIRAALEASISTTTAAGVRSWPGPRRRWTLPAAAALVLATAGALTLAPRPSSAPVDETLLPLPPVSGVAVSPFVNRTGDPSLTNLGPLAADAIRSELPRLEFLREPGGHAEDLAVDGSVHTHVHGAYYLEGENIRLTASISTPNGTVLHSIEPSEAPRDAPGPGIELVRQRILGAVVTLLDPNFIPGPRSRPPLYDAYREYAAGARLFGVDYAAAIPHFERALAIDPKFFSALNILATSYGNQGNREAQRQTLARAAEMRQHLTEVEQLTLDWSTAAAEGRYLDALHAIRQRSALEPDNQLALYLHAYFAIQINRPQEAIEVSDRLSERFLTRNQRADWPWARRTEARHLLGRHDEELTLARQAVGHLPASLTARANEIYALAALGRLDELERAVDDVTTLKGNARFDPGLVLRTTSAELRIHGHEEAAIRMADRAIAWYRSRPPAMLSEPWTKLQLGRALLLGAKLQDASSVAGELLELDRRDHRHLALAGLAAVERGDEPSARSYAAALAELPEQRGEIFLDRARLAARLGDRDRAMELLRDGLASGIYFGMGLHRDGDLAVLAGWPPFDELMRPKG